MTNYQTPCQQFPDEDWEFDIDTSNLDDIIVKGNPRCNDCLAPESCQYDVKDRIDRVIDDDSETVILRRTIIN